MNVVLKMSDAEIKNYRLNKHAQGEGGFARREMRIFDTLLEET